MLIIIISMGVMFVACGNTNNNNQESVQEHYTVALVTNNPNGLKNVAGFQKTLTEFGYVAGENTTYISKDEPIKGDDLTAFLDELVAQNVDLIFTAGTPTGIAAYKATAGSETAVVFGVIADPVASGVLTDLKKPGGNLTGVRLGKNQARRLESLLEIVPDAKRIFIPYDSNEGTSGSGAVAQLEGIADELGVELIKGEVHTDEEVTELLNNFPDDIDAIFMVPDNVVNPRLDDLLTIAFEQNLPVSGPSTAQVEGGALTTYGFVHNEVGAQAAKIADQILKGASPGDIPVETAEFFLVLNLATAEKIGLDIPEMILEQAETIIRE